MQLLARFTSASPSAASCFHTEQPRLVESTAVSTLSFLSSPACFAGAVGKLQLVDKDEAYGLFLQNLDLLDDFEQFAVMMRSRGDAIDECADTQICRNHCTRLTEPFASAHVDSRMCPRSFMPPARSLVDELTDLMF